MLPRYENTNIPHIAISTAILNIVNSTDTKTNAYHPSKDEFALDSSELLQEARSLFGDHIIDNFTLMLGDPNLSEELDTLTVNQKAVLLKELLQTAIEDNKYLDSHSLNQPTESTMPEYILHLPDHIIDQL